jgi:hypothetical protein
MKLKVRAALVAGILATTGCHITYDVKKTADPEPVVTLKAISVSERVALADQDEVSLGGVTRDEEVATYVGKNATEYHVKMSAFGKWTDEHAGFRMTYWANDDGVFPLTRWWWGHLFANDSNSEFFAFMTGFFLLAPPAAISALDVMMLTILPVADGSVTLFSGVADLLTGGLSAPVILTSAALTTGSPAPKTELAQPPVRRMVPAATLRLQYSTDLENGVLEATTTATGELRLPLGPLVEKAIAAGHSPLVIHLATIGEPVLRHDIWIGAPTLVELERDRLARTGIDRGATIGVWRRFLARLDGAPGVRAEVQRELSRLGFFVGLDDASALDALGKHGGGVARMADGIEVDWSSAMPSRAPKAQAELTLGEGRGEITAGEPLVLRLKVTDVGKGQLYQVRATVRCDKVPGSVVLLGKIEPGASVERRVELPTPVTLPDCDASVEVDFRELNDFAPQPVEGKVHIRPAVRPGLALSARAVDDGSGESVGNGDGIVQRGETVEYHIGVKNTGTAPAIAAHLSLTIENTGGIAVFGEREHGFGDIPPGEIRETTITISVKPSFPKNQVPIYAILTESSPFHVSREQDLTLTIDEKAPRKVIAIERPIVVNDAATLLAAADEDARSLGRVEKGSQLKAVGELDAFVQVEYAPGKRAWLRRKEISFDTGSVPPPAVTPGQGSVSVVHEFANAPPVIVFATPPEGRRTETGEADIVLKSTVKTEDGVGSIRVLLNGKPFEPKADSLRGIGGVTRAPEAKPGSALKVVSIDERIPLEPGENTIAIEATSVLGEKRSAEVVVVRSVREAVVSVLVVGIDRYEDASIPALRFAEADARAVAAFFKGPKSPARDPANVQVLLGKEATGAAIRVALEKHLIAHAAHKEDMAIFYFAGHGFSEDGRYFLATADTQLASLRATALKLSDLQDYWKDVRAERKVFIADACHSGGLVGLRGENAISTGVLGSIEGRGKITIAASREKQQSCESTTLGHGVFTAALLAGLEGRADQETGNKDGRVSVKELIAFLDREVPALARQENHEQNPNYNIEESEGEILLTR